MGIKAEGVATCLAQGNGLYEVGLCLAAIVKKDSVVLRRVLLCFLFFLEVDLLLMGIEQKCPRIWFSPFARALL